MKEYLNCWNVYSLLSMSNEPLTRVRIASVLSISFIDTVKTIQKLNELGLVKPIVTLTSLGIAYTTTDLPSPEAFARLSTLDPNKSLTPVALPDDWLVVQQVIHPTHSVAIVNLDKPYTYEGHVFEFIEIIHLAPSDTKPFKTLIHPILQEGEDGYALREVHLPGSGSEQIKVAIETLHKALNPTPQHAYYTPYSSN